VVLSTVAGVFIPLLPVKSRAIAGMGLCVSTTARRVRVYSCW